MARKYTPEEREAAYERQKARVRERYHNDPEYRSKQRAASEAWRKANMARVRENNRRWVEAHPERAQAYALKHNRTKAGIINPPVHREVGECPVCLRHLALVCDHDHATGLVRGWICDRCNRGLGFIGDTLPNAQRLVGYLCRPR